jgi:transcriptional regulator with XRE-family HTH domain
MQTYQWAFNPIRLRDLRELKGLSAVEFARDLGVSRITVANWERGKGTPTAANLARICTVYNAIPASFFVRGSNT